MPADRVSLTDGYDGANHHNRGIANEGESVHGYSKKQIGHHAELLGANKGALATQAGNGSMSTANSLAAGASMNTANAAGGADFVRRTAQHEDTGANAQSGDSRTVEDHATDLASKINYTA